MNLYLDTSAINRLYDDPKSEFLVEIIRQRMSFYPSVLVVAELCAESDDTRRLGLLRLTKRISSNYRPAAMPGDLLKRSLEAISIWARDMDHSMGQNWDGVWMALNNPTLIDKEAYEEVKGWKRDQEKWYQDMHDRGRPKMQEATRTLPNGERTSFMSSFSRVIRFYSQRSDFLKRIVSDLISRSGANVKVDGGLTERIIKHSEHWRFFLASMAYGMYARSLRRTSFSKKKNPGSVDTQQAVYLTICDMFVTADRQQRKMLRLIVPFGHKKRKVCSFREFKKYFDSI